ncbi:MAG: hypothetical protein GY797_32200 [Deltaproteobacteria bacterium]|nr:hypothetical protein [Deltaproteobacteria bacterium]
MKHLKRAFENEGQSSRLSHDMAFHMLDWLPELKQLFDLFNEIEIKENGEIIKTITNFLIHAPEHINAAKFIYGLGEVEDVFDLGVVKKRENGK